MHQEPDKILIHGLEIWCHVGVPDEELANPQRLQVDLEIEPRVGFDGLGDDIAATVDYDAVCRRLWEVASERPRRLIETLASDLAETVLGEFPAMAVRLEIRKFILEQTEFVGVRCIRQKG